jgi:hypothetical protein
MIDHPFRVRASAAVLVLLTAGAVPLPAQNIAATTQARNTG